MLSGRWGFSINDQRVYQQAAGEITELQVLLSNRLGSQTEQLRRGALHFHTTLYFAIFFPDYIAHRYQTPDSQVPKAELYQEQS